MAETSSVLSVAGGVYSLLALHGQTRVNAIVSIILGLIVLYILFGERGSSEFFGRR